MHWGLSNGIFVWNPITWILITFIAFIITVRLQKIAEKRFGMTINDMGTEKNNEDFEDLTLFKKITNFRIEYIEHWMRASYGGFYLTAALLILITAALLF